MHNTLLVVLFSLVLLACTKDSPIPPTPAIESCSPNPALEATWISDSAGVILTDSNLSVVFSSTYPTPLPNTYYKFNFTCQNNTPTFSAEDFQNGIPYVMHDTTAYLLLGNTVYFGVGSAADTASMDRKHIDYFSGNILHLRYTTIHPTTLTKQDEYFYLHK